MTVIFYFNSVINPTQKPATEEFYAECI